MMLVLNISLCGEWKERNLNCSFRVRSFSWGRALDPEARGQRGPYRRARRERCGFQRAGRAGRSSGRATDSRWGEEPSSGSAPRGCLHPPGLRNRSPRSLRPCCCCPGSRLRAAPADPAGGPTETNPGRDSNTTFPLFRRPPKRSPRVAVESSGSRRVSRGHHGRRAPALGELAENPANPGSGPAVVRCSGGGERKIRERRQETVITAGEPRLLPPHTRAQIHTHSPVLPSL